MSLDIRPGDVVTSVNGAQGTASSTSGLNSMGVLIVTVLDGGYIIPWDVSGIVRVERAGCVVWDASEPVQMQLFDAYTTPVEVKP